MNLKHAAALALLLCVSPLMADEKQDTAFLKKLVETQSFQLGQPRALKVAHDGTQVFFLRGTPESPSSNLYAFDVATRQIRELVTITMLGGAEKLTPEEKARRERMRVRGRGITGYSISDDGKQILIPYAGAVWLAQSTGAANPRALVKEGAFDPKLSPDGRFVAYVKGGELWVTPTAGGASRQLTKGASDTKIHAQAEFVAQEEMGRYTGYWWSPDSKMLAYEAYDSTDVGRLHLADPAKPFTPGRASEYPRAGTKNVDADLGVVAVTGGKTTWITWDEQRYPYLTRVTWSRGAPLTFEVMTRDQREQVLLRADPKTGKTVTLLIEKDEVFLNIPNDYAWLDDGSGFVWGHERDGQWALELRAPDGKPIRTLGPIAGERSLLRLDARNRTAVVRSRLSPVDDQVVALSLDGGAAKQIAGGSVRLDSSFARDADVHVRTTYRTEAWTTVEVFGAGGAAIAPIPRVGETPPALPRVEIKEVKAGGKTYFTAIVRPRDFDPKKRYPVIADVYGGPHKQQVVRTAERYIIDQWIADHGFLVVAVDAMGTPGRGRAWERAIYGRFMDLPVDGLADALAAMATLDPSLDLKRVGLFGHSFGGFMAAMAVMRRPDVFRAAVASAPVSDWLDYDTFYTERYLGVPTDDATRGVYAQNGLPKHVPGLTRPLLIAHGTADDNVLFSHALGLADALLRANKPFELVPLLGQTHMIVDPGVQQAYWRRIFGFFRQHLGTL
jgi:dipeptidyl-peptidase 4